MGVGALLGTRYVGGGGGGCWVAGGFGAIGVGGLQPSF
jgi:hypothetical protein